MSVDAVQYTTTSVVVLPTQETQDRLNNMFMSSPIEFDLKLLHIEIARFPCAETRKHPPLNRSAFYYARVIGVEPIYDPVTDHSKLVAKLACPELVVRARAFSNNNLQPVMVLKHLMPNITRVVKSFTVSISDTLVSKEGPFSFTSESYLFT